MDEFAGTAYRTLSLLAAGGFARVYEVEHINLRRRCVAKVLHAALLDDPKARERLIIEAQATASLEHENLVRIHDCDFLDDGSPFIVMEHLEGVTLRVELERRGALGLVEALWIACEAASALDAAHRQGIVHRDVKPENMFLQERRDGTRRLKMLDWGLAKLLDIGIERGFEMPKIRTREGVAVGTPRYMAPEQARGDAVDGRADIYALGVVLYEMLTGLAPVGDAQRGPVSASMPVGESRVLDALVAKAMADHPEDRYQSAAEFVEALNAALQALTPRRRLDYRVVAVSAVVTAAITFTAFRFALGR